MRENVTVHPSAAHETLPLPPHPASAPTPTASASTGASSVRSERWPVMAAEHRAPFGWGSTLRVPVAGGRRHQVLVDGPDRPGVVVDVTALTSDEITALAGQG